MAQLLHERGHLLLVDGQLGAHGRERALRRVRRQQPQLRQLLLQLADPRPLLPLLVLQAQVGARVVRAMLKTQSNLLAAAVSPRRDLYAQPALEVVERRGTQHPNSASGSSGSGSGRCREQRRHW